MSVKVLVFDTETTWFPRRFSSSLSEQPYIIQFWSLYMELGKDVEKELDIIDILIKPAKEWLISKWALEIHWISDCDLKDERPFSEHYERILSAIKWADYIVCHNFDFDYWKMLRIEMERMWDFDTREKNRSKKICTMVTQSVLDFCAIPWTHWTNYKWPKLQELHKKIFWTEFENAHDAFADVTATYRCFKELVRKRILSLSK